MGGIAEQEQAAKSGRAIATGAIACVGADFGELAAGRADPRDDGLIRVTVDALTPAQYASLLKWAAENGMAQRKDGGDDATV